MTSIRLPYTPYAVPVQLRRVLHHINLTGNALRRLPYTRNFRFFTGYLVSEAQAQMESDAYLLAREQPTPVPPVRLQVTVYSQRAVRRDADNLIAGLKDCIDGVAHAWGIDDSLIQVAEVLFEKGNSETILKVIGTP